jgi:hypothetical protein
LSLDVALAALVGHTDALRRSRRFSRYTILWHHEAGDEHGPQSLERELAVLRLGATIAGHPNEGDASMSNRTSTLVLAVLAC